MATRGSSVVTGLMKGNRRRIPRLGSQAQQVRTVRRFNRAADPIRYAVGHSIAGPPKTPKGWTRWEDFSYSKKTRKPKRLTTPPWRGDRGYGA